MVGTGSFFLLSAGPDSIMHCLFILINNYDPTYMKRELDFGRDRWNTWHASLFLHGLALHLSSMV